MRNDVLADDTARYLDTLECIFRFILGELNLSQRHLQLRYLTALKQLNIELTHLLIVAGS